MVTEREKESSGQIDRVRQTESDTDRPRHLKADIINR